MKIAVVFFNLGGPDSLKAVNPFLRNLFSDPAILNIPTIFRGVLARYISWKRTPFAKKIYAQMGGKSPILEQTEQQSQALEILLNQDLNDTDHYKCFIAMRYWHPFIHDTFKKVTDWKPDKVILLPLYPQFSTTTTGSSIKEWKKQEKKTYIFFDTSVICCYSKDKSITFGYASKISKVLESLSATDLSQTRILFSAHGLPKKVIFDGDPYESQVQQTATEVIRLLKDHGFNNLDWKVCYQSKVGPLEWLTPSTEDKIKEAGEQKKGLIICPIAFVSEHSETKVELDIEYKELSHLHKVPFYYRVPTLSCDPIYIQGLRDLIVKFKNKKGVCSPYQEACKNFSKCLKNE